jgi:hypothetical protein
VTWFLRVVLYPEEYTLLWHDLLLTIGRRGCCKMVDLGTDNRRSRARPPHLSFRDMSVARDEHNIILDHNHRLGFSVIQTHE